MPGTTIAGTRAEIAVPAPGSDSIASVPATRFTRCRIAPMLARLIKTETRLFFR